MCVCVCMWHLRVVMNVHRPNVRVFFEDRCRLWTQPHSLPYISLRAFFSRSEPSAYLLMTRLCVFLCFISPMCSFSKFTGSHRVLSVLLSVMQMFLLNILMHQLPLQWPMSGSVLQALNRLFSGTNHLLHVDWHLVCLCVSLLETPLTSHQSWWWN